MPRNYGSTNEAPYAAAPTVGVAGSSYYDTTKKQLLLADGTVWNAPTPAIAEVSSGVAPSATAPPAVSLPGGLLWVDTSMSGPPSVAYVEVASTAPPSANPPAIAPPMGLLWADTSTGTMQISAAYVPPQTPPATGTNFFTDGAGTVWVSLNGGAWKMARDVLWCRVYKTAAWVFPVTANALGWDAIESDVYALNSPGSGLQTRFTAPIAGLYHLDCFMATGAVPAAGQWVSVIVYKNGVVYAAGGQQAFVTGGNWPVVSVALTMKLNATDYLETWKQGSVQLTGSVAAGQCWADFNYIGTG